MPSTVADSDVFSASVQRPNNGELADAASLLQAFQPLANRTRFSYNRGRGAIFDITRAPFNADPTGTSLSTVAISAAFDAAAAVGGHVFSPPGTFRHGSLLLPEGVSIFGVPGKSCWVLDSLSHGITTYGGTNGNPSVIQDIRFFGYSPLTGVHIFNSEVRLVLQRCTWNGTSPTGGTSSNLQGRILVMQSTDAETTLRDCRINVVGDVNGVDTGSGELNVINSKLLMPSTYSAGKRLIRVGGIANISSTTFDCSSHYAGAPEAVFCDSTGNLLISGVRLIGGATESLVGWAANAKLVVRAITMAGGTLQFPYANPGVPLAPGSELDMLPFIAVDNGNVNCVIPLRYHRVLIRDAYLGNTVYTMPSGIVPGQILHLAIHNATPSSKLLSFTGTPLTGVLPGSLGDEKTLSSTFVWEDPYGSQSYRWVQQSPWVIGSTLV